MFAFTVRLSAPSIEAAKANLRRALAHVKSSHRCEALARGLRYRTYASLLVEFSSRSRPVTATVDGAAFAAYLSEHGFAVGAMPLYRALARLALANVLTSTPRLSHWGIGPGAPQLKADRTWETAYETQERFEAERKTLANAEEEFLLSLGFLSGIQQTSTIRPGAGSYRLKHIAERFTYTCPGDVSFGPHYVANGSLIAAAIYLGFKYRTGVDQLGYVTPNVEFNMSKTMIDDLDCTFRPDGGLAADRRHRLQRRQGRWQLARLRS